ncbi:hypothetical protein [Ralstonia sp. ASV6]|uniref:hypothetical protein n=1 Tax=Ralstonia sp. ASV6 TaxID=2795124 RepID=UPI0018EDD18A|nr:hypothetical protein [Ralstonia sp. ASV6]
MKKKSPIAAITEDEVLMALSELGEDPVANRVRRVHELLKDKRFPNGLSTAFAHHVDGQWHPSHYVAPQATSLDEYKEQVFRVVGDSQGVQFAVQGVDYAYFSLVAGSLIPVGFDQVPGIEQRQEFVLEAVREALKQALVLDQPESPPLPATEEAIREALVATAKGQHNLVEHEFVDPRTKREFCVQRSKQRGEHKKGADKFEYFLFERVPNGLPFSSSWSGPISKAELEALGFGSEDAGIAKIYHPTLVQCAREIKKALDENEPYKPVRQLTKSEAGSLKHALSEEDKFRRAQEVGEGMFKGCYSAKGDPLPERDTKAILSYLEQPSYAGWLGIRELQVNGNRLLNWCSGSWGREGKMDFPSPEVVRDGIRHGVSVRQEDIDRVRADPTWRRLPSGLIRVESPGGQLERDDVSPGI